MSPSGMPRILVLIAFVTASIAFAGCQSSDPDAESDASASSAEAPTTESDSARADSTAAPLRITMLDVGQGEAILLESPGGQTVLYDGGTNSADVLGQLRALDIETIDLVVASHPDEDHIGGLDEVIAAYAPRFVLDNGLAHTTQTYERYLDAIEEAGSQLISPERQTIEFGPVALEVVPPPGDESLGQNDNSVGFLLRYGDFTMSFYGDAERDQFEWLLDTHPDLFPDVQVHKSSHHASRNGDIAPVLERIQPEVVLASLGADNRYGHPHDAALLRYDRIGAEVYRTDRHGTIRLRAYPDGTYEVEPAMSVAAIIEARCVNVNSAAPDELVRITNVGPATAQGIIAARPFSSLDDLARVDGLATASIEAIKTQGLACAE